MATETAESSTACELNFDTRPIRRLVRLLRMDEGRRAFFGSDRRTRRRMPVRRTVYLTPVNLDGAEVQILGVGRAYTIGYTMNVSARGTVFTHDEPLLTRHAIATFDLLDAAPVSLVLQIQWSRCRGDRWYTSGGKFIAVTETPPMLYYVPDKGAVSPN